jgi:hypothetical protein
LLHTGILPGLGLLLVGAHYFRVSRLHGISLPAHEEESPDEAVRERAKERVNYLPDLWARELIWISFALLTTLALAAFVVHAPLAAPADSTRGAMASAPWFLLWWQGLLNDPVVLPILIWMRETLWIDLAQFYNSAIWQGLIVPMLIALLLLGVPYLDALWDKFWGRAPSRRGRNRKLSITLGLLALGLLVLFSYFGAQSFSSPAVAIAQEFLPDDSGEVRRIGYADLPTGSYELAKFAAPSADRFENLLSKLQIRVQQADLADAKGLLIVEDWQMNLKKITLRITWTPRAPGESGSFEKAIYLHRDSLYGQLVIGD